MRCFDTTCDCAEDGSGTACEATQTCDEDETDPAYYLELKNFFASALIKTDTRVIFSVSGWTVPKVTDSTTTCVPGDDNTCVDV